MSIITTPAGAKAPSRSAMADLASILRSHWLLAVEMARRELTDKYAGQLLGAFWAIGHPLLLMMVYLFVFGYVFRVRIGGTADLPLDYPAYLLAGLIPWMNMAENLNKSPIAISNNSNLVKQVVFPVEVLPLKSVLATLPALLVSLGILVTYVLVRHQHLPWTYALLPVLIVAQVILASGLAFMLSAVGVYFRDLKDITQVSVVVGMYLLPVFYLPEMVPQLFRPLLYLNPFSYLIWCYQDACYFGRFEHPWAWLVLALMTLLSVYAGYGLFRRLKPTFGSVL